MVYQSIDRPPALTFMTRDDVESTIRTTQTQACLRKTAIKTASCVCFPVIWSGLCICVAYSAVCSLGADSGSNKCQQLKEECFDKDQRGQLICKWSTCEWEPEWHAAQPPRSSCELIRLMFNPCIFCCCCTIESESNYLLPSERKKLRKAQYAREILYTVENGIVQGNHIPYIHNLVLQYVGVNT